jgi:SSS family solute:Na+ symporter
VILSWKFDPFLFLPITQPQAAPAAVAEANVAKITSLAVKACALLVVLFLPTQFALDLQLLGELWIVQTFPALIFGLYTGWAHGLIAGRAVGIPGGTWLAR